MTNVRVYDNGGAFCVTVDGMIVHAERTLGGAWKHIEWITGMMKAGYLDKVMYSWMEE